MAISTEADLGEALKNDQDTIEIEGDLKNKVLKIKATGKVAWAIAIAAIGVAVTVLIATGGTGAPASGIIGGGAVAVLGLPTAISAVSIAVAAGWCRGFLNSLRSYRIVGQSNGKLVLKKEIAMAGLFPRASLLLYMLELWASFLAEKVKLGANVPEMQITKSA